MKNILVAAAMATLPVFAQGPQGGPPMPPPSQGQPACQMMKIGPARAMQGPGRECPGKAGRPELAPFMKGFEKGFEAGFESGYEAGMKAARRMEHKGQPGRRHGMRPHGHRPHGMMPGCPMPPAPEEAPAPAPEEAPAPEAPAADAPAPAPEPPAEA